MTMDGIGARLSRKEDQRYLTGGGRFVGDITLHGMLEVAFLRSSFAHARIADIRVPPEIRDRVFIAEDLVGVEGIVADTALAGFKSSVQPVLATAKVRHVGEPIAMCVAATRAEAEDMASLVEVDFEDAARNHRHVGRAQTGRGLVHEHWGDNLFLTTSIEVDFEAAAAKAAFR